MKNELLRFSLDHLKSEITRRENAMKEKHLYLKKLRSGNSREAS